MKLVRSAEEAAEAVDPFDRVLLVGDGAIVPAAQQVRLAAAEGAAVLTVPEGAHGELYERIDAAVALGRPRRDRRRPAARDRGACCATGTCNRPCSGARSRPARPCRGRRAAAVAILDRDQDLDELERRIIAGADTANRSWSDFLLAPIERLGTLMLIGSPLSPQLIGLGAALLTALGAAAFYVGWYWIGLIKLLAATPLEGIATRLARLRMQSGIRQSWWAYLVPLFAGAACVILAYGLMPAYGWGMVLLAFVTLAFLDALAVETEGQRVPGARPPRRAQGHDLADPALRRVRALAGRPRLPVAYAAASFFWAQRQAHAAAPAQAGLAPL